jgi:hypothetical protein
MRRADAWCVAAAAALARAMGAGAVLLAGFRVVSDDDFARVVIAQKFAAHPKLDPTGTSWLPLPFWIVGAAMRVFGSTLGAARAVAIVGAMLGGAIVGAVAVRVGLPRRRAIAASLLAAFMPWAMQLAVATVPEVPAAALAAAGAMALASTSTSTRMRLVGACGILASCWSRYDAWPMAIAFAVYAALDAFRARGRDRILHLFSGLIAIAGPGLWTAWQAAVYHDPFRYLGLVRSYRQALGSGPPLWKRVIGYPLSFYEGMREVLGAGIVGLVSARALKKRRDAGESDAHCAVDWTRPLVLSLAQLLFLILGDVRDGAPTHHAERALLAPATIVIFASADALGAWLARVSLSRARAVVASFVVVLVVWIAARTHKVIPWYDGAPRPREVALGRALADVASPGTRVLLDTRDLSGGSPDYGYYAVLAAFGRPLDVDVDRDQDPRKPRVASSFATVDALSSRAQTTGAHVLVAWGADHRALAESTGAKLVVEEPDGADPRWFVLTR